jgi:hypothetical protein
VTEDVFIDQRKCHCAGDMENCRNAVVRRRSNKPLRLRQLATDPGDIDTWDLSIFGRPAQFGLERHPLYNSERVKKLSVRYLNLGFEHAQARARFATHFKMASLHRDDQENKVRQLYNKFHQLAARPREASVVENKVSGPPIRQQSVSTPVAEYPPRLLTVSVPDPLLRSDTLAAYMGDQRLPTITTVAV